MLFFIGVLLFPSLILLRKYCRIGFLAAQILAAFAWIFVHYNTYFYELVTASAELWIFASLAALAVKPKEKEETYPKQ